LRELVRTNNAVLVCSLQAVLDAADIPYLLLDQNMSVLEGSIGILPRRLLVAEGDAENARQILQEAGFGRELRPDND
jgi:Putative prokaryotic signal transducing protein